MIYLQLTNCVNSLNLINILLFDFVILLRYLQVVVWGRVVEINEKLAQLALTATVYLSCSVFTFFFSVPGEHYQNLLLAWSKNGTIELPIEICMGKIPESSSLFMDAL